MKTKKLNQTLKLKDIYVLIFLGLFLALNLYVENIILQITSLFVLSIYFLIIEKYSIVLKIILTYIFFSSFLLPTTFYFFNTFNLWLAIVVFLASPSLFTIILSLDLISKINKSKYSILFISIFYLILSFIFLSVYPFKTWWIPHIGYTQSVNFLSQIFMPYIGIFGLFLFIIFIGFLNYNLFKKFKLNKKILILYILIFYLLFFGFSFIYKDSSDENLDTNFILVQHWFYENGMNYSDKEKYNEIESVDFLFEKIDLKYENIKNKSKNTIVIFGEVDFNESLVNYILNVSKEKNYFISFSYLGFEKTNTIPYNKFMFVKNGEILYTGFKENKAPGEKILEKKNDVNFYNLDNLKIFSAVCYDLHFISSNHFLKNKDLIIGHVNDFRFGKLLTELHKRDIVFRAIENNINIVSVGLTGPTFFVDRKGIIKSEILPFYKNEILVLEKVSVSR